MSFKDIKGQDRPIQILKEYLKTAQVAGAYLFTGEDAIGKQLAAFTLAKAINCLDQEYDSCDGCSSCAKIDKGRHPDIHFIGLTNSDNIKIESIRDIKRNIALRPYEAKMKVFIINDAHNLTPEAANSILKILEEPPKDSIFILISSKPALLFKTIISRCKIIKFYPLKRLELKEILRKDYRIENNLAHFLAYFCEGRIGKALKLKDTDILMQKNRVIDEFAISKNPDNLEMLVSQSREDLRGQLNILTSWFRDIYLIKTGLTHSELINLDRKDELLKLMNRYTFFDLDEALRSISDSLLYLEQNANIKLLLSNLRAELWKR
jgi:DNA polymerase-3 subunit delta'